MIRLLIFDWDDTITHGSLARYAACYQAAVRETGQEITLADVSAIVRKFWGSPISVALAALLKSPEKLDQAVTAYRQYAASELFTSGMSLVEGARATLEELAKTYTLALATGSLRWVLEDALALFSIPPLFAEILTSNELSDPAAQGKPHGYMASEIMRRLVISPEETLVIGDAPGDLAMAAEAGARSVAVLTGYLSRDLAKQKGASYIIDSVRDLPQLLADPSIFC